MPISASDRYTRARIARNAATLIVLSLLLLLSGCRPGEVIDVRFFYLEICPSCDNFKRANMIAVALVLIDRDRKDVIARSHHMIDAEAYEILIAEIEKRRMPNVSRSLPLLFVDGNYYVGYNDIEAAVQTLRGSGS